MRSFEDRYPQDAELTHPVLNEYGQTDFLNRKFKRLTWLFSVVFLAVLTLLVMELTGVVPISPFQPGLKITDTPPVPAKY
jgi:hypothetical protein